MDNLRNNPPLPYPNFPAYSPRYLPRYRLYGNPFVKPCAHGGYSIDFEKLRKISECVNRLDAGVRKGLKRCGVNYNQYRKHGTQIIKGEQHQNAFMEEVAAAIEQMPAWPEYSHTDADLDIIQQTKGAIQKGLDKCGVSYNDFLAQGLQMLNPEQVSIVMQEIEAARGTALPEGSFPVITAFKEKTGALNQSKFTVLQMKRTNDAIRKGLERCGVSYDEYQLRGLQILNSEQIRILIDEITAVDGYTFTYDSSMSGQEHMERTKSEILKGIQKCGISLNENQMFGPPPDKLTQEQRGIVIQDLLTGKERQEGVLPHRSSFLNLLQPLLTGNGFDITDEIPQAPGQELKKEDQDGNMSEEMMAATDGVGVTDRMQKAAWKELEKEDEAVKMSHELMRIHEDINIIADMVAGNGVNITDGMQQTVTVGQELEKEDEEMMDPTNAVAATDGIQETAEPELKQEDEDVKISE